MTDEIQEHRRSPFRNPFRKLPKSLPVQYGREAAFRLESGFFDDLLRRLEEMRTKHNEQVRRAASGWGRLNHDAYGPETLPNRKQLETLIEAAFWASLQREEGRSLKFTINYCGPSRFGTELKFREPRHYEVITLSKLGPAVGNQILGIAVSPDKTGDLEIWGLNASFGLQITVIDPGKLIVKFRLSNVAAISGDQTVPLRYPDLPFVGSFFWNKFAPEGDPSYLPWSDHRVSVISTVLRTMRGFGHGGAIIVLPENCNIEALEGLGGYQCDEPSSVLSEALGLFNELRDKQDPKREEVSALEGYRESLARAVAALTCVDGATLLTRDLRIIGFGAKFKFNSATSAQELIKLKDPLDHEDYLKRTTLDKVGGTRHQSAAQFVRKYHDAIAFVASQDGNVTAFVWEECGDQKQYSSLTAYTHLELTMF